MALRLGQVTVEWGFSGRPSSGGYNEAMERICRQAAADAGFDKIRLL